MPAVTETQIYQIKITLLGTRPPIWRVLVPGEMTLGRLHDVIQIVMGWQDCHLHQFRIGSKSFGPPEPALVEDDPLWRDESNVRLSNVLRGAGAKAEYNYDFGDDWQHTLAVEKVLVPNAETVYPVCIAGKRSGPPEDCGGVGGYDNLIDVLQDPDDPEHVEMLEWLGGYFDPEAFSIGDVNRALAPLQRRRAKSAKQS
jgi:hypothetical protein